MADDNEPAITYAAAYGAMWTVADIAASNLTWIIADLDWLIKFIGAHDHHKDKAYRDHELERLNHIRAKLVRERDYLSAKYKEYNMQVFNPPPAPLPPVAAELQEPSF